MKDQTRKKNKTKAKRQSNEKKENKAEEIQIGNR